MDEERILTTNITVDFFKIWNNSVLLYNHWSPRTQTRKKKKCQSLVVMGQVCWLEYIIGGSPKFKNGSYYYEKKSALNSL